MRILNRELSWLSFNERVLQEALDSSNPLIERMRFLGIYSNNLDEFYRVRVAYVRRAKAIKNKKISGFDGTPAELFNAIKLEVMRQQKKLQVAYKRILKELEKENIFHIDETQLTEAQTEELYEYFELKLKHAIVPIILNEDNPFPSLKDSSIYFGVKMEWDSKKKKRFALIQIPKEFPRFYRFSEEGKEYVILLDDIIRLNLNSIFSIFTYDKVAAYTFKFSRDAELDLDDDISTSFIDKIEKSIEKRKIGDPVRFVYDEEMPHDLLEYLLHALNMEYGVNNIPGGKYHNFKDFMSFPDFGRPEFVFKKRQQIKHIDLDKKRSLIKSIMKHDVMLHYPYQRFDYVVDLLREAAIDPKVKSIRLNVYRVAEQSQIMNALLNAVHNGKQVFVNVELQARFDEENNVYWSNKLQDAGAKVSFGISGWKVHSKLIQIHRIGSKKETYISYIGTGNFHERTARIYEDVGLITTDIEVAREVERVFDVLDGYRNNLQFDTLIVSPFNTRERITQLLDNEIANAKCGKVAKFKMKLNNLVDEDLIEKLYEASNSGVKIQLLVRGICCLIPGIKGMSENIIVRSIVGRYLEHSRFMIFANGGSPIHIITSGDWMERNLDRRIEVGVPIKDKRLKDQLDFFFSTMWKGNVKSRVINKNQTNQYYRDGQEPFNSQDKMYEHYLQLFKSQQEKNQLKTDESH